MADKAKDTNGRRDFLKLAGLGTLASGATLVAGEADASEAADANGTGYRETDHVRKVYETARF